MSHIIKNPYDTVDLSLLLESFNESIGTLYPIANVYTPDGALLSGSPFVLTHLANNLYVLRNAFQAEVNSGTYMIVYEIYTDAGHTIKSDTYGQRHDTVAIQVQSSTGLGGAHGGDFYYDDTKIKKLIEETFGKLDKKINKLQKDFDNGLKIELPEQKTPEIDISSIKAEIRQIEAILREPRKDIGIAKDEIIKTVKEIKMPVLPKIEIEKIDYDKIESFFGKFSGKIDELRAHQKKKFEDVFDGLRKNRNVTIKSKFDKTMISPLLEAVLNGDEKIVNEIENSKNLLTKTIDIYSEEIKTEIKENTDENTIKTAEMLEKIDESNKKSIKFLLNIIKKMFVGAEKSIKSVNEALKESINN